MKKTVAQVDEELQELKANAGNVQYAAGTCWNHAQMGAILEKYARHGELVKAEVTVEHSPGNNAYRFGIWHYPLLNSESRRGDEYVIAGLSGHDFQPTRAN